MAGVCASENLRTSQGAENESISMIEQTLHDVYSDIKEKYQSRGLSPLKHLILSNTKQELVKKDGFSSNG